MMDEMGNRLGRDPDPMTLRRCTVEHLFGPTQRFRADPPAIPAPSAPQGDKKFNASLEESSARSSNASASQQVSTQPRPRPARYMVPK